MGVSSSIIMSLSGADDAAKLDNLSTMCYKDQAIWVLNAEWHTFAEKEAENIWTYVHHCNDLDLQDHEAGNHLDEMMAHRFLELIHSTLTVREMREGLRAVGITKVKSVPLVNFLIFKYKIDWHKLVHASQGDNQAEVEQAQKMLNDVMKALEEVKATASAAAKAEVDAINAKNASIQAEKDSIAAKAELEEALKALHAEEEAYNKKKADLEQKSQAGGVVSRNKAANELAQLLAEDPLPLRRAKITQEAAVKKAERATKAAADAVVAAKAAVDAASAARVEAEKAVDDANNQVAEAEAYLNEVKSKPGSAAGALWWIDRELHEQKEYLPTSKGGNAKK